MEIGINIGFNLWNFVIMLGWIDSFRPAHCSLHNTPTSLSRDGSATTEWSCIGTDLSRAIPAHTPLPPRWYCSNPWHRSCTGPAIPTHESGGLWWLRMANSSRAVCTQSPLPTTGCMTCRTSWAVPLGQYNTMSQQGMTSAEQHWHHAFGRGQSQQSSQANPLPACQTVHSPAWCPYGRCLSCACGTRHQGSGIWSYVAWLVSFNDFHMILLKSPSPPRTGWWQCECICHCQRGLHVGWYSCGVAYHAAAWSCKGCSWAQLPGYPCALTWWHTTCWLICWCISSWSPGDQHQGFMGQCGTFPQCWCLAQLMKQCWLWTLACSAAFFLNAIVKDAIACSPCWNHWGETTCLAWHCHCCIWRCCECCWQGRPSHCWKITKWWTNSSIRGPASTIEKMCIGEHSLYSLNVRDKNTMVFVFVLGQLSNNSHYSEKWIMGNSLFHTKSRASLRNVIQRHHQSSPKRCNLLTSLL